MSAAGSEPFRGGAALPTARYATAGAAALLAAGSIAQFGVSLRGLLGAFFLAVLAVVTRTDLERRLIPNRVVLPATAVVLAGQAAIAPDRVPEFVLAGLGAACFLALPLLVSPQGVGMGDVKLALLLGVMLGRYVSVSLVVAFLAAFVAAVIILLRRGAGARRESFAFGPFLAVGGAVALFFGEDLAGR
jgi:leader peptidase (prepilin peptidase) / N-methyltransferase